MTTTANGSKGKNGTRAAHDKAAAKAEHDRACEKAAVEARIEERSRDHADAMAADVARIEALAREAEEVAKRIFGSVDLYTMPPSQGGPALRIAESAVAITNAACELAARIGVRQLAAGEGRATKTFKDPRPPHLREVTAEDSRNEDDFASKMVRETSDYGFGVHPWWYMNSSPLTTCHVSPCKNEDEDTAIAIVALLEAGHCLHFEGLHKTTTPALAAGLHRDRRPDVAFCASSLLRPAHDSGGGRAASR